MPDNDLGIAARLRRIGRPPRTHVIATRFTEDEAELIKTAASKHGVTAREWVREAMLRAASDMPTDLPVFTELVALRMLLNTVLRSVVLGEKLSAEAYAQVLIEVRTEKHDAAQDMLRQYKQPNGGN